MIDTLITDTIIIGSFILLAAGLAAVACWAMDRHHERTPLFVDGYGRPEPLPPLPGVAADAPFPGDPVPVLAAAPVAEPPEPQPATDPDQADDTVWSRHEVKEVWKRLRAEAGTP